MSESQTKALPEAKREPREPRALSSEYHKARKQLLLWAGILFIWELVGIDLSKAEGAEGNIGTVLRSIRSPQAIPWALLILVAYFLFKLTVEWYQCSLNRRALRVAQVDFLSAWLIAILAYTLYAYQAVSRLQFADILQKSSRAVSVVVGLLSGFLFAVFIVRQWNARKWRAKFEQIDYGLISMMIASTVLLVLGITFGYLNWAFLLAAIAAIVLVLFVINLFIA
jgi:hypothetical protein